jgi:glycosyltransferase involved in cell wall biosynthesis
MRHLIICREYPPTVAPPGGIGTYAKHIAQLLADAGDVVHVIGERSDAAPLPLEVRCEGRLVVHRIALDGAAPGPGLAAHPAAAVLTPHGDTVAALARSAFPPQAFAYQVALLAEELAVREGIDVIEGPEWEAPLYHLQLRRALGLGPAARPPCLVHLHSPTEFIFRHNEWETSRPDYMPAKRLEDYTVGAADGLLCPSRYLADQAEAHYGLAPGDVTVIPLPIGDTNPIERAAEVWASGSVCFVGRLEPRKGVVEWVDAAVSVAREDPDVRFEFVGADLPYAAGLSVRDYARGRIPEALRSRFHFHGSRPRAELREILAGAWACAVPSRWENFPNSCVEAMGSGAPVIASPAGGMAEMVEDERSGWIAASPAAADLADALRRALATPPDRRHAMGVEATARIRRVCDNDAIVQRHREVRADAAARGAGRSGSLPAALAWRASRAPAPAPAGGGTAVVVVASDADEARLTRCLAAVDAQSRAPVVRVLVSAPGSTMAPRLRAAAAARGWQTVDGAGGVAAAARMATLGEADGSVGAVAFVTHGTVLAPTALAECADALARVPEVGVISPWVASGTSVAAPPCPALPDELLADDGGTVRVFRAAAFVGAGGVRPDAPAGYELWDATTAVLAAGWAGVTYPAVLAHVERAAAPDPLARAAAIAGQDRARRSLLARVPEAVAYFGPELVARLESQLRAAGAAPLQDGAPPQTPASSGELLRGTLSAQLGLVRRATSEPGVALRWAARVARAALGAPPVALPASPPPKPNDRSR